MRRNKINRVIPTEETTSPKIFSSSSLFFREWLRQEVEKAAQEEVLARSKEAEEMQNTTEKKPRLSRNRKKC